MQYFGEVIKQQQCQEMYGGGGAGAAAAAAPLVKLDFSKCELLLFKELIPTFAVSRLFGGRIVGFAFIFFKMSPPQASDSGFRVEAGRG